MVEIKCNKDCCGCGACVQVCPKQCISFEEDIQGFRYPVVDKTVCIDCNLCEKVCPVLNQGEPMRPAKAYAAINPDEKVRMKSSSGGIFTMLAESVIGEGGVVFGASFDENWEVGHIYVEDNGGLERLRGSKYMQSRIGKTYKQAEQFLKDGRKVLFSGTPCQIAGFKNFLRRDYENLLTVDVVCHGVPSPLVWRSYMKTLISGRAGGITGVSFRDKSTGWKGYSVTVEGSDGVNGCNTLKKEPFNRNLFMKVFLNDLCLRPSCTECPAKGGKSGSDITLADYWGVGNYHPHLDDDKGVSLVLVNSKTGEKIVDSLGMTRCTTSYTDALKGNPSIVRSVKDRPSHYGLFWKHFQLNQLDGIERVFRAIRPNIFRRVVRRLRRIIKNL